MINTDKPSAWTVYGVEQTGHNSWTVVATRWTPEDGPLHESTVQFESFDTEAEARQRAAEHQRLYDKVRRAALAGA